ncbi:cytochrome P450 [Marasmius fiardii PR-910]|nr:cytochrome P450 [Marasmius fiardii PR-910]
MLLLVAVAAVVLVPLYLVLKKIFGSHPLDKIPGPKAASWWNGHFDEIYGIKGLDFYFMMAERYGPTASFKTVYGVRATHFFHAPIAEEIMLQERQLYTFDPKAMHHILVKDQGVLFEQPPSIIKTGNLIFGGGLFGSLGEPHRRQLPIFYEVTHRLQNTLAARVQNGPQEVPRLANKIEMLSWMGRAALELIGQSGFGYSFDTLADEEHAHPYVRAIKEMIPLVSRAHFARTYVLPYIAQIGTPTTRRFMASFLPSRDFQQGRHMSEYMWALSKEIFEEKRDSENHHECVQENEKASEEDRLDDDELIAQDPDFCSNGYYFGVRDVFTCTALSRILSLLATHPEVQAKFREEIHNAFQDGDVPYDQLVSLQYLDAIARETMRVYPPVHRLARTALKDAILPLSTPVTCTDGSVVNEIFIPRNTDLLISIVNLNRNKAIWGEDADEWKPERLSPLPQVLVDAKIPGVYSHLMTFNGGGRSCIGFKFSQLEMKVVLALLIQTFEFSNTPGKEISWLSTGINSPIVVGSDMGGHPEMLLMVKLVKRDGK